MLRTSTLLISSLLLTAPALGASSDRDNWAGQRPGATINAGQSQYIVPAIPAAGVYSLTGNQDARATSNYWNRDAGQFINVGNARVYVPAMSR